MWYSVLRNSAEAVDIIPEVQVAESVGLSERPWFKIRAATRLDRLDERKETRW
jgi:hypothetical protein